jgi:hypothetical protein
VALIDAIKLSDRAHQQAPMAKRCYSDFLEVLIGHIRQDDKADVILGKALSVLPEAEFLQPLRNLLHWRPPGFHLSPFWTDRAAL